MKYFKFVTVYLVLVVTSVSSAENSCFELFDEQMNKEINQDGPTNPGSTLYSPIYSEGQDVLASFKFDEGPSPQRNMSIPPEPKDQYVFTSESAEIFKQKAAITKRNTTKVIQFLEGYENDVMSAVREQFERMLIEFGKYYPDIYETTADSITNKITGDKVTRRQVMAKNKGPYELLEMVGKLVQEDWLLMKKDPATGEYILIGGYLAFPTHWSLDRAIGWSLSQIHSNIPGTPDSQSKFVQMISMVLDRSLAAPDRVVVRNNWFLEADPRYALPDYIRSKSKEEQSIAQIMDSDEPLASKKEKLKKLLCVRIERQTLRGLPGSGVVVFSINPYVYKLTTLMANPGISGKVLRGLAQKYPEATDVDMVGLTKDILRLQMTADDTKSAMTFN